MDAPVLGFFAYPSKADISEIIRNGVAKINQTGIVRLKTWESCRIGGKLIIGEICDEIERSSIFCADLTGLNHNVMFELGFAIARNKRIWLVMDTTVVGDRIDFTKLKILTTVGYAEYCNSNDLQAKFLKEQPWIDLQATVFKSSIQPNLPTVVHETLLYLKSRHMTEASTFISKEIAEASTALGLPLIIDDPRETTVQPLAWYGEQVYSARCIVVDLINPSREGAHLQNAKYSFVAGLAHGLNKSILMLSQGDSLAPLDYRDLLKQYQTASEAERHLRSWLVPIMQRIRTETKAQQQYLATVKLAQQLAELKIGEPIAENEADRLVMDYFVETVSYREALDGRQAIFVGRKGTGKSANFLKLADALESDKRNLVCLIKPISYEMRGIVELMQRYQGANLKGYAIESIWKFLIYSEIALAAETRIKNRISGEIFESEKDLIALLNQYSSILRQDFSVRLERCIKALLETSNVASTDPIEHSRIAVAEILHASALRKLREVLVSALSHKQRIAILVDNLDKAWDKQTDIDQMSEFLLGLLSTTNRVAFDFRNVGLERKTLNVSLAVFVRSDIFHRIVAIAREPDKIDYSKLNWNDDEMLIRVIEERFSSSLGSNPADVWIKYFCPAIHGLPIKQYFLSRILKRPRDLVYFVKAAITTAVNRRHGIVEVRDVLDAEKQYSQFAVDSILVENGITIHQLENIIYEFVGGKSVLDESEITTILSNTGVDDEKADAVIKHLCGLTFLGVEVDADKFRFAEDLAENQKNSILAQRLVLSRSGAPRYKINPAFWAFLEIKDGTEE
jgi:hypothetical protein